MVPNPLVYVLVYLLAIQIQHLHTRHSIFIKKKKKKKKNSSLLRNMFNISAFT